MSRVEGRQRLATVPDQRDSVPLHSQEVVEYEAESGVILDQQDVSLGVTHGFRPGSSMVNRLPPPSRSAQWMRPPCPSTMERT